MELFKGGYINPASDGGNNGKYYKNICTIRNHIPTGETTKARKKRMSVQNEMLII